MRVFTFQPYQLSSMQQGIQSNHATVELMKKFYPKNKMVKQWADKDLTLISKNGGTFPDVEKIFKLFKSKQNTFPFVEFREPDIFNHITSVAICLPKHIYEDRVASNEFEEELISLLKRTRLAQ